METEFGRLRRFFKNQMSTINMPLLSSKYFLNVNLGRLGLPRRVRKEVKIEPSRVRVPRRMLGRVRKEVWIGHRRVKA